VSAQWSVTPPPPDMAISPLPRSELPLTVFIFVQETSVSCFVASQAVRSEVSALSVFKTLKLSLIFHRMTSQVSQLFSVCIVDILDYFTDYYRFCCSSHI